VRWFLSGAEALRSLTPMGIRVGERARVDEPTTRQAAAPRWEPWLVPPKLRTATGRLDERHASWLELFFDFVFVVALLAESTLPPVALAAALAFVLCAVVVTERTVITSA
jgi:hypothetical protein